LPLSPSLQFNAGSAGAANYLAGHAFYTTNTATATAMMSWLLLDHIRGLKFRATGVCVGAVVGLVAITPAAGGCWVPGLLTCTGATPWTSL
jgi:Amt family ammonium transporter